MGSQRPLSFANRDFRWIRVPLESVGRGLSRHCRFDSGHRRSSRCARNVVSAGTVSDGSLHYRFHVCAVDGDHCSCRPGLADSHAQSLRRGGGSESRRLFPRRRFRPRQTVTAQGAGCATPRCRPWTQASFWRCCRRAARRLSAPRSGDSPACGLAAILNSAATDERIETRIANGAFADLRLDPLPAFLLALRERFDARVERLDFTDAGAAETINA